MLTLESRAGFCKRSQFNSLNNLEYNIKDFLEETPAPVLSYSCSTKLERHSEGAKENRIQSEKMIFNKANESS